MLGGVALPIAANGGLQVKYASGVDLLRQTPEFVSETRAKRLDGEFRSAYRYLEVLFEGRNPYIEAIDRNVHYLRQILRKGARGPDIPECASRYRAPGIGISTVKTSVWTPAAWAVANKSLMKARSRSTYS